MNSSINVTAYINGTTSTRKVKAFTTIEMISLVLNCIIFVLGVLGNGLVIYVTGFKMKSTVNSICFLNLALADFLFTFFLVFNIHLSLNQAWPFGDFMCKFISLVQTINMFASIFLLTAISLDRCLTVWVVIWAHNKRTPNKARICCVVVWLLALACSTPFVISRGVVNNNCVRLPGDLLKTKQLALFRFMVGFLIPFLIITCCYVAIGVRASRTKRKTKLRPYFVILAVILAFFICWLPFQITDIIMTEQYYIYSVDPSLFNNDLYHTAQKISPLTLSLAFLNSCMNPFLYIFMCEEFKQKLKRSVFVVLEHAFAEEHLVFLSSQFSVTSRQSIVSGSNQRKATQGSLLAFFGTRPSVGD